MFVADWTFGRVIFFEKDNISADRYSPGETFAISTGQRGFAVTDLDFDCDGSLLISVGGRGTEGGIYRVVGATDGIATDKQHFPPLPDSKVTRTGQPRRYFPVDALAELDGFSSQNNI